MVETQLRRPLFVAVSIGLMLALAGPAPAQQPVFRPAPIDRNGVLILVRATLSALDQANKTGNYTVFRDLAAPSLAAANDAAKLGDIFASERREHLDLSGVLVLDPQLTVLPEIDDAGNMRLAGFFPSVPTQVNFRLQYAPVAGQWRLGEIGVNVGPSGPVAPTPPPAPVAPSPAAVAPTPAPVAANPVPKKRAVAGTPGAPREK